MISKKLITKSFVFVLILFMLPSLSLNVYATLVLEEPELLDVEVTWGSLGFIYDNQYHNSTEVWEEISMFEQQTPDLIDVEVIGNSYYGKEIKSVRITNELRIHQNQLSYQRIGNLTYN